VRGFQAGQLGGFAAEALQRGLLLALETLLAQRQLVEIHQVAVEIGAVHAGEFHLPPTVTRHDPHMPVPSTMMEFRLTTVGTPNGRVVSQQAFIIGIGPMATTSRTSFSARQHVGQRVRDEAFAAIAAVVGGDDQLVAEGAEFVFPEHQVAIAEADDGDGAIARCLYSRKLRIDGRHAQAAAHQHHGAFSLRMWLGSPERPDEIEEVSPSRSVIISKVVLPTAWMTTVTVPRAASKSATVSGMRSPCSSMRAMMKWPGRAARATSGAAYFPEKGRRTELLPTSDEKHYTSPEAT
jgi:hypothetical protein